MNSIKYTNNFQLSLIHQYYKCLNIFLKENRGINWIMESILEDLHYTELVNGEWGKKLLCIDSWYKLTNTLKDLLELYKSYNLSDSYAINEIDFYSNVKISELRMDCAKLFPLIEIELKKFGFDLIIGKYFDGTTYEDHLQFEPENMNLSEESHISGSLIKDLMNSIMNKNISK